MIDTYLICDKVISTEFVLSNITQFKVKSKAHPQNHSSGINRRETHSITWKQQGYVGNYYLAKQLNSCVFLHPYQVPTVFISSEAIIT